MQEFRDEIALCVHDYFEKYGEEDCFEACSGDMDAALETFKKEAEDAGIVLGEIRCVEFLEFDSNNFYHAFGYFLVTYDADKSVWWQDEVDEEEGDFPQGSAE